ncbi:MAG: hypothetical protein J7605_08150 [Variovorax sp.]|nr:hypothetical protein [Variovorax sp.]
MVNQIQYLQAKRRICNCFMPDVDPVEAGREISDEDLVSLLNAVIPSIPWSKPAQAQALNMFLFAGVTRFDRWFVPTPFVVPATHQEHFAKFVAAFRRAEGDSPVNCAVFQLHAIKDQVFEQFNAVPIETVRASEIQKFRKLAQSVPEPSSAVKKTEYEKERADLIAILAGLQDLSLRTRLQFRVPYVIHNHPLRVDFSWRGIAIRAQIQPSFGQSGETFVQTESGGAALSVGASRWQTGSSGISLELSTLLDGSAYTERLQAIPGADFSAEGWPQSFTWAFSIFHDLAWRLRAGHGGRQDWIPAPRDLSDLEQVTSTAGASQLGWIKKGSPAALYEMFVPSTEPVEIDLGTLERLPWAAECRTKASMYLELGDTNEALFWLNVATESLIAQRFDEIELATGRSGLAISLGSPKEFWAEADMILSEQFPDMQGRVKWPTSAIHVSVYGKLKALYRLVPMKTKLDELLAKYRAISGQRNDLFHGKSSARVPVATVQTASEALNWIDLNMWPQPASIASGRSAEEKP